MIATLKVEIREQILNHLLAIIKVTMNRQVQYITVINRSHLQLLHFTNLTMRMKNTDLDSFFTADTLNGSRPSIPRGCSKDVNDLVLFFRNIRVQLTHKLQRYIFEGKSRAMEQFQYI
ncbi:hypothetical protein D3C71_1871280 [compost metagenome]